MTLPSSPTLTAEAQSELGAWETNGAESATGTIIEVASEPLPPQNYRTPFGTFILTDLKVGDQVLIADPNQREVEP